MAVRLSKEAMDRQKYQVWGTRHSGDRRLSVTNLPAQATVMPRLVLDSPSHDSDVPGTPPDMPIHGSKFSHAETAVSGDDSGDEIQSGSKQSNVSGLIDDLEDVSGDFDESVSEKEFSLPDNKQRPVSKEDITPARIPEVPYEQKEEAKRAGAWWAPKLKKWYV
jgi:hypothetical protein